MTVEIFPDLETAAGLTSISKSKWNAAGSSCKSSSAGVEDLTVIISILEKHRISSRLVSQNAIVGKTFLIYYLLRAVEPCYN